MYHICFNNWLSLQWLETLLRSLLPKMSNYDLWVRDILASYGVITMIISCITIWIIQKWPTWRKNIYKTHLLGFEMEYAELASPYKEHLFKTLQCMVSNDEMLRSMGCIRILEIGIKTGVNRITVFPYNLT